jgi:TonB family protein
MGKLFILIIFFSANLFAQNVVEIKKRKTDEIYHVLKKDKLIKNGQYTKYYEVPKFRKKEIIGHYVDNQKDSLWNYYTYSGKLAKEVRFKNNVKSGLSVNYFLKTGNVSNTGNFKNGNKIGIWKYFNENGILIHEFDYQNNKLTYFTRNEIAMTEQPNELLNYENGEAMILGGNSGFTNHLSIEFNYPKEAQWNGISGKVFVKFLVDENFKKQNYRVLNNPGYGIGEEAIRLIEDGPLWIPEKIDGKYQRQEFTFPITFNIQ